MHFYFRYEEKGLKEYKPKLISQKFSEHYYKYELGSQNSVVVKHSLLRDCEIPTIKRMMDQISFLREEFER